MSGEVTVGYLQKYIRAKDSHEDPGREFFLRLTEEVGELLEDFGYPVQRFYRKRGVRINE